MRQNGQSHILERDGFAVKQLQIIGIVRINKRSDHFGVKLAVVSLCNTVLQLIRCIVRQKALHHLQCRLLIGHPRKRFEWNVE